MYNQFSLKCCLLAFLLPLGFAPRSLAQNPWVQVGGDMYGEADEDRFGHCTAINDEGSIVAVSSVRNAGNGENAGHVRVFENIGGAWTQMGADIDGDSIGDLCGFWIDLDSAGTVLAIGAVGNEDGGTNAGQVRVFAWDGNSWNQKGNDIDGLAGEDFGYSLDLSADGNTMVVGLPRSPGLSSGTEVGGVRVYTWNGSAWLQMGTDLFGSNNHDRFGVSVSISADGNTVAVGAPSQDPYFYPNLAGDGYAHVYSWNGSAWVQKGWRIYKLNPGDFTGLSVDLDRTGNVLAVGSNPTNLPTLNQVRVFAWVGNSWVQRDTIPGGNDGRTISLNGQGNKIVLGSAFEYTAPGTGVVRVYGWNGNTWFQVGTDIQRIQLDESFGYRVQVNSEGNTIAIGAPSNDSLGFNRGAAVVYSDFTLGRHAGDLASIELRAYPNPIHSGSGQGQTTLTFGKPMRKCTVTVRSTLGRVISSAQYANTDHVTLDIAGGPGLYLVEVKTPDRGRGLVKVVKL